MPPTARRPSSPEAVLAQPPSPPPPRARAARRRRIEDTMRRPGQVLLCATLALANQRCVSDFTIPHAPARAASASSVAIGGGGDSLGAFGAQLQLTATVLDSSGAAISRAATWVSDAPDIASVNANGLVTANGNGRAK